MNPPVHVERCDQARLVTTGVSCEGPRVFVGCHSENESLRGELRGFAERPEGLGGVPFDDRGVVADGPVVMLQQRQWNTAESKAESGVLHHAESGVRICAWARIDNREDLIGQLPADLRPLAATDSGMILAAYLRFGGELCERLVGDFAFAIHDPRDGSIVLGRDHLGVRPLFWFWNGRDFVFATSQGILDGAKSLDLRVSEEWLARSLVNCSPDWNDGAFDHVFKVPPAHIVTFQTGSEPRPRRYFEFSAAADLRLGSDAEYVEAYREILRAAVRCRVRTEYPVATELSGGLDASAVTALASREMPNAEQDLRAYGFANHVEEPACIMAVSQRFALRSTYLITSTANSWRYHHRHWPAYYRSVGTIPEQWNGFSHWPVYEPARHFGARTLLSGFGGDEFVTNPGHLAREEFLAAGNWRALAHSMKGNRVLAGLRAMKFALRRRKTGAAATPLMRQAEHIWNCRILNERFDREDLRERTLRGSSCDQGWRSVNEFALQNRLSPALTARLENCTLMAAVYGLDYRWPLLDLRLVKFYLSAPAEQKFGPQGVSRYLHRRAVDPLLPAEIVWKGKPMGERIAKSPGLNAPLDLALEQLLPELQAVVEERRLNSLIQRCRDLGSKGVVEAHMLKRVLDLNDWLKSRKAGHPGPD